MKKLLIVILLAMLIGCSKEEPEDESSPTGSSSAPEISIVSSSYKVTEKNDIWWAFSWKAKVKNGTGGTRKVTVYPKFYNANGYEVYMDMALIDIGAQSTVEITDRSFIKPTIARTVTKMKVVISGAY